MSTITYSDNERNIIMQGTEAISKVLFGFDLEKKASLLFALDKYLDPYYKYDLPYASEIFLMLEKVIISNDPIEDIQSEAIHLIEVYSTFYCHILEINLNKVDKELLPYVNYILSCE